MRASIIVICCLSVMPGLADQGASQIHLDDGGGLIEYWDTTSLTSPGVNDQWSGRPLDGDVLWHYHIPDGGGGQRNTCAFGNDYDHVLSGGWFLGFKLFATLGDGQPVWEWYEEGSEGHRGGFAPVGAESADIFYGVWYNNFDTSLFRIYRFDSQTAGPLWTYDASAAGYTTENMWSNDLRLDCTPDGSLLAVGVKHDGHPAVLFFGPDSSTPLGVWEDTGNAFGPSKVRLSDDGSVVVLRAGTTFYRVDVATAATVASWSAGSNEGWAVSTDASLMGYANAPLTVVEWNAGAGEYQQLWQYQHPGSPTHYVGTMAFSDDNAELAVGWWEFDMYNMLQCFFTHHQVAGDGQPDWEYATPRGTDSEYQDRPVSCSLSADGRLIAFGTWGNADQTHDEVLVFDNENPTEPYYGLDHLGSCEHVELSADGLLLTSAGKTVHVNEMGSGGDVYAAELDPLVGVGDGVLSAEGLEDGVLLDWTSAVGGRATVLRDGAVVAAGLTSSAWLDRDAAPGRTHRYTVRLQTPDGELLLLGPVEVFYDAGTANRTALNLPHPCPCDTACVVEVELSSASLAELVLYDLAGRRIQVIHCGVLAPGRHDFTLQTSSLSEGLYLLRLTAAGEVQNRRLIVAR